jgi:ComF family protein
MLKATEYSQLISSVNRFALQKVNRSRECLFPTLCALCGDYGQPDRELCPACERDLPAVTVACLQCGAPLPVPGLCGRCQRRPPAFVGTVAVFHYRPPVDILIKRLKFKDDLRLARLLGGLMADRLEAADAVPPDLIVPVPLHARRLRRRGFNQALELAHPIARRLAVPLNRHNVIRTRATDPQSDLPAGLRSRNVKDAFAVAAELGARHVAIVDDVMTTGHTVNELALTLRNNGVTKVSVWVCARAVFGA